MTDAEIEIRMLVHDVAKVLEMLDSARNCRGDDILIRTSMAIGAHDVLRLKSRVADFLKEPHS